MGRVEQLAGHVARRSSRVAGGRVSEWPDISRGDQRIVRVFPPGLPPARTRQPRDPATTLAATDPPRPPPPGALVAATALLLSERGPTDPLDRTPTTAADAVHVSRLTVIFISAPRRAAPSTAGRVIFLHVARSPKHAFLRCKRYLHVTYGRRKHVVSGTHLYTRALTNDFLYSSNI